MLWEKWIQEGFSQWSSEDQPGFFLLELWNKVIRAADCMESCGRWVSTAVMIKLLGKSYRERERGKKGWRRQDCFPSLKTKSHFILILDYMIWLKDALWLKWLLCICQQQSPFTRKIHHYSIFLFLSGRDVFVFVVQMFDIRPFG